MPVSNGDEQNSTGKKGASWPSGVDITQDGHYAIFGDVATSTIVEVSDISSGKLTKTVLYNLGRDLSAATVRLSPDETLLYIANTQGGEITAAFFDKTTGVISKGCVSKVLKGFGTAWAYLGSLLTEENSGTGGIIYVAEYGAPSSIGMVEVTSSAGQCTLTESANSPVSDPNSPGLLSIGIYPPRPF
jgi:DNA-binding beta-propeller fold protein YncE